MSQSRYLENLLNSETLILYAKYSDIFSPSELYKVEQFMMQIYGEGIDVSAEQAMEIVYGID